jgi:eukaryotic-like serine/threonine-protein kinase
MFRCPTFEQLERLVQDRLEIVEREAIADHVQACKACQDALDRLTVSPGAPNRRETKQSRPLTDGEARLVQHVKSLGPPVLEDVDTGGRNGEQDEQRQRADGAEIHPANTFQAARSANSYPSIAGFIIVREIGRGGMGIVYEAEEKSLNRAVALKVLPPGALSEGKQVQRFEREAKAAARLHHTNIVPVFGVGQQDGQPYYVMQYIEGLGLNAVLGELRRLRQGKAADGELPSGAEETKSVHGSERQDPGGLRAVEVAISLGNGEFGATGKRSPEESAEIEHSGDTVIVAPKFVRECNTPTDPSSLFGAGSSELSSRSRDRRGFYLSVARIGLQVAEALEYANGEGVLHRDIKPSNLLLDARGRVWLTDFGLAKMVDSEDLTHTGDFVGTLRYMAPERFRGMCDERSDVYSLGLTLYEMVALRPAFDASDRHKLIECVLHTEPPRLRKLVPTVPRDLATIIEKMIAPGPERRYATAAALADDLRRFVNGRSITARRASAAERAVRWCRRNPWVAVSLVLLVLGTALSGWQAVRATFAERTARRAEASALTQRKRAEDEAEIAEAINEFLNDDLLAQASSDAQATPDNVADPDIKVRTLLDRAAGRISGKFADKPLVEASIRRTIGNTYYKLGLVPAATLHLERALELYQKAVGEENVSTLETMVALGELYTGSNSPALAESLLIRAREGWKRLRGPEHPDALSATITLAQLYQTQGKMDLAEGLLVEALTGLRRARGKDHIETIGALHNLAMLYKSQGKLADAEPLLREARDGIVRLKGPKHPDALVATSNLGQLCYEEDKLTDAERLLEDVLRSRTEVLGHNHPLTLDSRSDLAMVYGRQRRWSEAEKTEREVLDGKRGTLGPNHRSVFTTMVNLASFCALQNNLADAERLLKEALDGCRRMFGWHDPDTRSIMASLGNLYQNQHRFDEAERLLLNVVEESSATLGADNPDTLAAKNSLAALDVFQAKAAKAEPLLREVLTIRSEQFGPDHTATLLAMQSLAACYLVEGKLEEAEPLLEDVWKGRKRVLKPDHPDTIKATSDLADCYRLQRKLEMAEKFALEVLEMSRRGLGTDHPDTAGAMDLLGMVRIAREKYSDAEELLQECLKIREKTTPDHWSRFNTERLLGDCLLAQKKYDEAEKCLLSAYRGMKQRERTMAPTVKRYLFEAAERLVQLYDAQGNKDKADEWLTRYEDLVFPDKPFAPL